MTTSIKFPTPFVKDLGANPGKIEFSNIEEAFEWIRAEIGKWDRILKNPNQGGAFHDSVRKRQSKAQTNILSTVNDFRQKYKEQPAEQAQVDKLFEDLSARLDEYASGRCIHSDSASGRKVLSIDDNNTALSALAFIASDRHELRTDTPFDVLALLDARARLEDRERNVTALAESLETAAKSANASLAEKSTAHARLVADEQALVEAHRKLIDDAQVRLAAIEKDATQKYEATRSAHEAELADLRAYYKEHLAVAEIVKFWDEKEEAHKGGMVMWGGTFVLLMAAAALIVFDIAPGHIDKAWDGGKLDPKHLVYFTIPLVLVVWSLRVCSRMFSLNAGLRWDARERIAMGKTFLSLTKQASGLNDHERAEVIKSLFRPAAVTGSDDSPMGVVDEYLKKTPTK